MKIAQIAPLYESVPPKLYGGTERVVSYLTEELVRLGHDVTLFASGDSVTSAKLHAAWPVSLRLDPNAVDQLALQILELEHVFKRAREFDVLHFHVDYLHYPFSRRAKIAHLTTLHGRLDIPELPHLYDEFHEVPVVSISDSQRSALSRARWLGTVYHGLPESLYRFHERPDDYFAFLGRVSPEKRVDRAVAIARRVGRPLRIAAKVSAADRPYFVREIQPLLAHPLIRFLGEIGEAEKNAFLGGARALLFPIEWPEPFGLAMIEALACGTPVIAFRRGSVPEILEHGVTGFIVDTLDEAVDAARRVDELDRAACRRAFETRFSAERMTLDYLSLYEKVR